ncbi:Shikimate dehydrogenase (NADP(+)) [Roseobacter fucihabitans]|uniref:Shikimate dehydrogenase (NADP(+)) n=1 Tax=Roseobacter fucihabitans TaxID=1537242 RepID=A0ABZ2C167_9RHOB|nr:shikimate dehydrogenase [Roseobacter litoralis]MBC6963873.1 Shikimate dehydrogenase [Roseobacter litoralis]MBC6964042.1 Shikimate dehydrogenase [Roseobacter litoralis]
MTQRLAKIPLAGVIGAPIAHSKSPLLHGHWLKKYGIKGFYIPMEVASTDLRNVLTTLPKAGFVGVNVTIPHKEAVFEIADVISDHARLIGAANTLVFSEDGKIHADNTDGYGFLENLKTGAPNWDPSLGPAVVLGAGGAARAVIMSLLDAGVPQIMLTNRTHARAEQLEGDFGNRVKSVPWEQAGDVLDAANLLVNTTSLGMVGKPELAVSLDRLEPSTVVTDLVYTPLQTLLLTAADQKGCVTVDGLGMLLHQAVPGFERWFGHRPVVDADTRAAVLI